MTLFVDILFTLHEMVNDFDYGGFPCEFYKAIWEFLTLEWSHEMVNDFGLEGFPCEFYKAIWEFLTLEWFRAYQL